MKSLLPFVLLFNLTLGSAFAEGAASSKSMNPDIGANFIVEAAHSSLGSYEGIHFREAEFSLKSDVDPYFTANMIFSVAEETQGKYSITPEEVYADTTSIPQLTLRIGKFYGLFGKQNTYHTHAFPFIDVPLISSALLSDGFNLAGVSGSLLLPTRFFSELTLQGFQNFLTLAHLRALFELTEDSTLECGVSGINQWAYGVDITFKHRPTDRGQGRRFNLAGEWMSGQVDGFTSTLNAKGLPTQGFDVYGQYEFLPKTYAQYRFDDLVSSSMTRHGILVGFAPSEFSVIRIQADHAIGGTEGGENRVIAQMNFTIGFHPAHEY